MFWRSSSGTVNSEIGREAANRRWRIARRIFLLLALIVGVIFLMGVWEESYTRFQQWRVESFADNLKKLQDEDYRRAMADTYGGTTPQETLRLYIEAVEKGDYELASKYFVLDGQEKELESLKTAPRKNIENINQMLKQALLVEGSYSPNEGEYGITRPIFVGFIKYPNNVWKITRI